MGVAVLVRPCVGFRTIPGFHHHILGQNVLAVKEHLERTLHLIQRELALMESRENGDQHIGVMLDFVQIETVFVIAGVQAFVVVKFVLQVCFQRGIGGVQLVHGHLILFIVGALAVPVHRVGHIGNALALCGVHDDAGGLVVLGMENAKANTTDPARIVTLDKNSGSVIDTKYTVGGGVRSTISYDKDTDAYYFTSNGGYFYKATIDDEGNFTKLDSIALGGASTSTPTVLNGRAYVGVNGSGWGDYKGSVIAVIDLDSFEIAYKAETKGYPQTSGLGVVNENGYNYVYFSENASAGAIRYVKDKKGVTEVLDAQIVNGKKTAPSLFTPTGAQAQYAIADLVADENGTIYFKNDSGYIMAVGSEVEKLVTENAKTVCKEGEAYDASDLKVYAVLKNGVKKDVTDYVTIDDTALTADDDFVTVTYKYGMYRDKTNEGAANTTGVAVSPVETTINVTVLAAEDYDSVKAVEKLISDLGEITLDSENDIKAARVAYDALGDLKEYVGNVDALTAAEKKLEELKTPSSSSEAESSVSSSDVSSESTVSSANSEDTSSATSSAAESVSSADTSKAADSSSKTANNAGAANPNTGATAGVCVAGLALLISGALTVSRKRK